MYRILVSILLVSVITGFSKNANDENNLTTKSKTVYATEKNKAPGFSLTGTDGKLVKLSNYKGKIVIIDFWATWCSPCRKGIPDLIELQKEFGKKVVVIGISLDTDSKRDVVPFMQ